MCGAWGHERRHAAASRAIFEQSWGRRLDADAAPSTTWLATGHSCRTQVERFRGFRPRHPAEHLAEALSAHRR